MSDHEHSHVAGLFCHTALRTSTTGFKTTCGTSTMELPQRNFHNDFHGKIHRCGSSVVEVPLCSLWKFLEPAAPCSIHQKKLKICSINRRETTTKVHVVLGEVKKVDKFAIRG
jgi:hypothetical protein